LRPPAVGHRCRHAECHSRSYLLTLVLAGIFETISPTTAKR
jgi:hypothetical protein